MARITIDLSNWKKYDPEESGLGKLSVEALTKALKEGFGPDTKNKLGETLLEHFFVRDKEFKKISQSICKQLLTTGATIRPDKLFVHRVNWGYYGLEDEIVLRLLLLSDKELDLSGHFGLADWVLKTVDWSEPDAKAAVDVLLAANIINEQSAHSGDTLLHSFVSNDELEEEKVAGVIYLLEKGANPHLANNKNETPLELFQRKQEALPNRVRIKGKEQEVLLAAFASAMATHKAPKRVFWDWSEDEWRAMTPERLQEKLDEGCRIDTKNKDNNDVAWHLASYCDNIETFRYAIELGILEVSHTDMAQVASDRGGAVVLDFLLTERLDWINYQFFKRFHDQTMPSIKASIPRLFDFDVANVWLQHGLDINKRSFRCHRSLTDMTPLSIFLLCTDSESHIRYLLARGANPLVMDESGRCAIDNAHLRKDVWTTNGIIDALYNAADYSDPRWILRYGTLDAIKGVYGSSRSHYLGAVEIVDGIIMESPEEDGHPLMLVAGFQKNAKAVEWAIDQEEDMLGSAIRWAAEFNESLEVLNLLFGRAQKLSPKEKWDPLMSAARHNPNPEVIQYLIDKGCRVDQTYSDPSTTESPIILAAKFNSNPEVIRTLLTNGALKKRDHTESALYHSKLSPLLRNTEAPSMIESANATTTPAQSKAPAKGYTYREKVTGVTIKLPQEYSEYVAANKHFDLKKIADHHGYFEVSFTPFADLKVVAHYVHTLHLESTLHREYEKFGYYRIDVVELSECAECDNFICWYPQLGCFGNCDDDHGYYFASMEATWADIVADPYKHLVGIIDWDDGWDNILDPVAAKLPFILD